MAKQSSLFSIGQKLHEHDLYAFDSRTFAALLNLDHVPAAHLLSRMEAVGLVVRIERGKYLLLGLTPEKVLSNPYYIGNHLATPSYVSFWSALHYYGFTDQAPRLLLLATTLRKGEAKFRNLVFRFVRLQPQAFFGYRRENLADLPVTVADEAKAIIDSMLLPQYAGGLPEVARALRQAVEMLPDLAFVPTLVTYANQLQNGSLSSRLGYLLELLRQDTSGLQPARGPVTLDPQALRTGEFNARWKVYVNVSREVLFPEGVV